MSKFCVATILVGAWGSRSDYTAVNRALPGYYAHGDTLERAITECATEYLTACGLEQTPMSVMTFSRDSRNHYLVEVTAVAEVEA